MKVPVIPLYRGETELQKEITNDSQNDVACAVLALPLTSSGSWTSYLAFLSLDFLICKMGLTIPTSHSYCGVKQKHPALCLPHKNRASFRKWHLLLFSPGQGCIKTPRTPEVSLMLFPLHDNALPGPSQWPQPNGGRPSTHLFIWVGGREGETGAFLDHGWCDIARALRMVKQEGTQAVYFCSQFTDGETEVQRGEGLSRNQRFCFYLSDFFFPLEFSELQQSPNGFVCSALSGLICEGQHLAQKESKAQLWLSAAAGIVRILIYT